MNFEIPLSSSVASFTKTVNLSGVVFMIRFDFNQRIKTWSFSLIDSTNTVLYRGLCRPGINIISQIKKENMPKGRLFFLSLEASESLPDRDNLGDRVILIYDDGEA